MSHPHPAAADRSPEQIRRDGNHLVGQSSLYLQQHAHNPVDWYPWGPEALARARRLDRPVFLSIGYASCHWCHVMEHAVFQDDTVAAFLNDHFVCIKVDREERPDLDAIYMDAVVALTGRGGWPLNAFLTPDGRPFFGGTYFPRERFLELLRRLADAWTAQRDRIEEQGRRLALHVADRPAAAAGDTGPPDADDLRRLVDRMLREVDPEHGGLGGPQKFPTPLRWRFLLHQWRREPRADLERALRRTLDAMAAGGIHDHLGGGFHRYAVEASWTVPHFEIMLYDNAQLALLYLEAGAVLGEPRYTAVAAGVLDFLLRDLEDPGGGFHASFDADSDGREGAFYLWTPEEITAVAGPEDGPPLAMLLGVTRLGNFEGRSILTRRVTPETVAARFHRDPVEMAGLFDRYREALYAARSRRLWPVRDRKLVTAWNGLAIAALARGAAVTGRDAYREAAVRAARRIWETNRLPGGGLARAGTGGVPAGAAVLDDVADLADGLLDLYQVSGDTTWFARARELLAAAERDYGDPERGYLLAAAHVPSALGRRVEWGDSVEPSGFAALLHAQLRAAALAGDPGLRRRAAHWLAVHGERIRHAGPEMAWWADAADLLAGPSWEVVIAGDPVAAAPLREAFWSSDPFHAVLAVVPAAGPDPAAMRLLPPLQGRTAQDGSARAFVCRFGACGPPVTDPAVLVAALPTARALPGTVPGAGPGLPPGDDTGAAGPR